MSEIRTLGKHAIIYGAGIAVGRLAGLIMLPIYTRFLSTQDYGTLELLTLTVDFLGTIASAGVASAVFKFYADREDERDKRALISTSTITLVGLTAVLAGIGIVFAEPLTVLVLGEDAPPLYFRLFFLIHLLHTAETIPLMYMRVREQSATFAGINVVRLVVSLGLNIWFVVFLRLGVLGVLYSSLITGVLFGTGLTWHMLRETGLRFERSEVGNLVRFGSPIILWSLSNFLIVFSDRYFLRYFAGTAIVGIYSVGVRFALLIRAFGFQPFNLVWGPKRFEIAKQPDGVDTIRRVFGYLNLILGTVGLMIVLFAREVIVIMADSAFHDASRVVPLLVGAQILYHLVAFPNLSMLVTERTRVMGSLALVTAAIVLGLNLLLIPRYGLMGAAYATFLAYLLRFVIVWAVAQRIHRLEYGWGRIVRIYAVLGGALAIEAMLPAEGLIASTTISAGIALVALGALYGLVLDDAERTMVRSAPSRLRELRRGA